MIEAPGWVLFSYTLLRKEPRIIPRQPPESIGSIYSIPIDQLHPHPDNPFGIRDDPSMLELIESVKKHGVLVPAIARPKPDGGYELVAGHRRQRASQLAGLDSMPVIVMNLDDNDTIIQLVDSNIQRENILPSERAKAYKLRMEAVKKKAGRPQKEEDQNSPKISANFRSDDSIGELAGVSGDTIRNYISLTNLIPELMEMVDEKKIALSPAYQIAALPQESQNLLYDTIESEQATPSLSQAQRIRKLSQSGKLNEDLSSLCGGRRRNRPLCRGKLRNRRLSRVTLMQFIPPKCYKIPEIYGFLGFSVCYGSKRSGLANAMPAQTVSGGAPACVKFFSCRIGSLCCGGRRQAFQSAGIAISHTSPWPLPGCCVFPGINCRIPRTGQMLPLPA